MTGHNHICWIRLQGGHYFESRRLLASGDAYEKHRRYVQSNNIPVLVRTELINQYLTAAIDIKKLRLPAGSIVVQDRSNNPDQFFDQIDTEISKTRILYAISDKDLHYLPQNNPIITKISINATEDSVDKIFRKNIDDIGQNGLLVVLGRFRAWSQRDYLHPILTDDAGSELNFTWRGQVTSHPNDLGVFYSEGSISDVFRVSNSGPTVCTISFDSLPRDEEDEKSFLPLSLEDAFQIAQSITSSSTLRKAITNIQNNSEKFPVVEITPGKSLHIDRVLTFIGNT